MIDRSVEMITADLFFAFDKNLSDIRNCCIKCRVLWKNNPYEIIGALVAGKMQYFEGICHGKGE